MVFPFRCLKCGAINDVVDKIGAVPKPPSSCECGNTTFQRVYTTLPIHYNASGFYHTDKALYGTKPGDYETED